MINYFKNLFLLPIRVKKISAVIHNSLKKENERSQKNDEMLQILLNQQKTEVRQKPATKKILILGTSNSLFKGGWVAGLSHALQGYQIKNMSVGASQGFQFAGIVSQEDFSQYDYVFF